MQFTSTQKRAATWCLIALLVVLALWFLGPVLTPFVVAAVLAYALTPVVDKLDDMGRGRLPRVLAVLMVETMFVLVVLSILLLVVPIFAKELPLLREQLPLQAGPRAVNVALDVGSIKAFILKYLNTNWEEAMGSVLSSLKLGGSVALAIVGNLVLIPVALFFLLKDWNRFVAVIIELVPPKLRQSFDSFIDEADSVLGQYLRGQLLVMGVLAVYFSVALALFGFDLAVPVGVFTGLAFFIPYLGFGLGLLLAFLAGILQFGNLYGVFVVVGVYGAGQLVESFFLTPRLVGERIGLHPLVAIFSLLAFGQLLGFIGVLIALPASAVLLVAIRRLRASYMTSKLYNG